MKILLKNFLLLLIVLASADVWSDVGDVYYCTTIKHVQIDKDGQMVTLLPESFKFKLAEEVVVFGETAIIDASMPYKLTFLAPSGHSGVVLEHGASFRAETPFSRTEFDDGTLLWSTISPNELRSFVAKCEIFK